MRYLLDHGVQIEQPREAFQPHDNMTNKLSGSAGASALWVACSNGCVSTAQFLLLQGAQVDSADDARTTPLHAACCAGHDEMVRLLLENDAGRDVVSTDGQTPLIKACAAGHCECVRVLCEAGAEAFKCISIPHQHGGPFSAYWYAFKGGHSEVVAFLQGMPAYAAWMIAWKSFTAIPLPPSSPEAKGRKPKRTTPMRERAEKAGVSDKLQATPPGIRETIASGSPSSSPVKDAKQRLQAVQKSNHQIISRAEIQQPRNADNKKAANAIAATRKSAKRKLSTWIMWTRARTQH